MTGSPSADPRAVQAVAALAAGTDELTVARWLGLDERELLDLVLHTFEALGVRSLRAAVVALDDLDLNAS